MPEAVKKLDIKLSYSGVDVNDGSMSIEDFVEAVQGFSGVYGRIAAVGGISQQHKIRITGIEKGSVDILLTVRQLVDGLGQQSDGIQTLVMLGGSFAGMGMGIVKALGWLIKLIKHTKKKPHTTKIKDSTTVVVQNFENVMLEVPVSIYNLYRNNEGGIRNDLYKIAKPLEENKIDEALIEAWAGEEHYLEKITLEDKSYFDPKDEDLTRTDRVWIQGAFNSLTKSTNKGFFYLTDGSRVSYELRADNPENLYQFFLHKGVVKVEAIVHLDQNLRPTKLDIYKVETLQMLFDFPLQENEGDT